MQKIKLPVCFLLIVILLLNFVSSEGIKISPTKAVLEMKTETQNCTNIYFLPDKNTTIENRWAKEKVIGSENYNLSKEQIRLKINYTRQEYGKYEFCFTPSRAGTFYGVIFFQQEGSLVKMGTWIELKVESKTPIETISLITGNVIGKENATNIGLGLVFILLLVILFLIVRRFFSSSKARRDKHS